MTSTVGTGPFGQTPAGVFNDAVSVNYKGIASYHALEVGGERLEGSPGSTPCPSAR